MFMMAVAIVCFTACAQKKGDERGHRQGGHMEINKDSDSVFVALKQETLSKFKQLTFKDEHGEMRTHQFVSISTSDYMNGITHWPDCKYCKERGL